MTTVGSPIISGSGTTSWTVAPPSGIANGEWIVGIIWSDSDGDAMAPTGTYAAGWTLVDSLVGEPAWNCKVYKRQFSTGEASYSFSSGMYSSSSAHFFRVQDMDATTNIIAEFNSGSGNSATQSMTAPAIASYDGADGAQIVGYVGFPGYSQGSWATPSGFTTAGTTPVATVGSYMNAYAAYKNLTGSPAVGTTVTTGDNSDGDNYPWGACTVLIVNAGGGDPDPGGSYPAPTVASGGRSTGGTGTTNTGTHTITIPSGINGKLVVVLFAIDGNPTLNIATGSGDGWLSGGSASNGANVTGAMYYKTANGSDALVISSSVTEQSSYAVYVFDDASTVFNWAWANGSSTNSNPPACTVWTSDDYRVLVARMGDAKVQATGAPSGFGTLTTRTGGTAGASIAVADQAFNGITTDPATFTSVTEQWVALTLFVGKRYDLTSLSDDFDDNVLSTSKWELSGGTYSETGGEFRPSAVTAGTNSAAFTMDRYHVTDGLEIVWRMQPPSASGSTQAISVMQMFDYSNFSVANGLHGLNVWMDSVIGQIGMNLFGPTGVYYDGVTYSYGNEMMDSRGWFKLKFNDVTNTVDFFISSNGRDWWKLYRASLDQKFFDTYRMYIALSASRVGGSLGTAATFDNFRIPLTTPPDNAIFSALINQLYWGG